MIWLFEKDAVIPSHSCVIARAGSIGNALRHLELKFCLFV